MNSRSDDKLSHASAPSSFVQKFFSATFAMHVLRTGIWAVCYFIFYFVQQLAELLAPFLFIAGLVWKIIPIAVSSLNHATASLDQQAKDIISSATSAIPSHIDIAGHVLTPDGLIRDGIMLMLLAAAGATLATLAGKYM
ncbi:MULTISPECIES: hypothetical protein [Acetobacter]|uniref:hypothetical protein n=1 Tax=Acetobacter TaxID=434 RepID=UPI000B55A8B5|nr:MULTISPECIES: hypothetical protein [Acetobacter]OUI86952.1 hypothetical protein HK11_12545 [Acetobacter sp. DmW_043]